MGSHTSFKDIPMVKIDTPRPKTTITVRPFRDLSEMGECVRLQQLVWGYSDRDVVPSRVFLIASRCNGQVLGAFDRDRAIGFSLAFLGSRDQQVYLHSHMVGVHPDYQNLGVGRQLKLAQRAEALARGIDLIEWTFDPLQTRNAYFNLVRLGAIVRSYIPNFYGNTSSPLHGGLPTDRLVAEWRLRSPHVLDCIAGKPFSGTNVHGITMPRNIAQIADTDPAKATQMQSRLRFNFEQRFAQGYAVVGLDLHLDHVVFLTEHYED
jgi:predicted GNAT superfamily acetyltransferase